MGKNMYPKPAQCIYTMPGSRKRVWGLEQTARGFGWPAKLQARVARGPGLVPGLGGVLGSVPKCGFLVSVA